MYIYINTLLAAGVCVVFMMWLYCLYETCIVIISCMYMYIYRHINSVRLIIDIHVHTDIPYLIPHTVHVFTCQYSSLE